MHTIDAFYTFHTLYTTQQLSFYVLPCLCLIAFVHSSVGLAGGSSYTAFMAVVGIPTSVIPSISLSLNTLVSSIGAANFVRFRHFNWRIWLPFQLSALPFVYIGAQTRLPTGLFYLLLLITLSLSCLRLAWQTYGQADEQTNEQTIQQPMNQAAIKPKLLSKRLGILLSVMIGVVLGFLSGSLGIGGGIYLIPCMLLLGIATAKQASAVGVVFILVNSVIGLISKWQHGLMNDTLLHEWIVPALVAVGIGGLLGSWFGAKIWAENRLKKMLLLVMSIACCLLMRKLYLLG